MSPMPIAKPRLKNFKARQAISSSQISTSTYLKTITVSTTSTETVTTTATTVIPETVTAITTVYVVPPTPSQSPLVHQAITTTITSNIIRTTTEIYTGLTIPSARVSVATTTTTDTVSSTALITDSTSSRPPLSDHSSQRTITGLAVTLAGTIIIACIAGLFWRKRKQGKAMTDSQSAASSNGLVSYTSEPYKSPIQKSMAYGVMSYFRNGEDGSSGVTFAPDSQIQTLNDDGNEEFFPRSLSQCTGIGVAL